MDDFSTPPKSLILMRAASRWATFVAFLVTGAAFFYSGPRVESILFPPVSHFEVTKITPHGKDATVIRGVMFKPHSKSHCQFLGLTVTTTNYHDPDKIVQVQFEPNDVLDTRPPGAQEFGPWKLHQPDPPMGPFIIFRSLHRCHPLWNTETELLVGLTQDFFSENLDNIEVLKQDTSVD